MKPDMDYTIRTATREWTQPTYMPDQDEFRTETTVLCYLNDWENAEIGDICNIKTLKDNNIVIRATEEPKSQLTGTFEPRRTFDPIGYTINEKKVTLYQRSN